MNIKLNKAYVETYRAFTKSSKNRYRNVDCNDIRKGKIVKVLPPLKEISDRFKSMLELTGDVMLTSKHINQFCKDMSEIGRVAGKEYPHLGINSYYQHSRNLHDFWALPEQIREATPTEIARFKKREQKYKEMMELKQAKEIAKAL